MASHELLPIAISISGTGFILLLTLPSITHLLCFRAQNGYTILPGIQDNNSLYEDEDGAATLDSEAAYSSRTVKIVICVVTTLGLATSLASAVLSTVLANARPTQLSLIQDWMNFTAWVCVPRDKSLY
jgi:hypothetical protein